MRQAGGDEGRGHTVGMLVEVPPPHLALAVDQRGLVGEAVGDGFPDVGVVPAGGRGGHEPGLSVARWGTSAYSSRSCRLAILPLAMRGSGASERTT